VPHALARAIAAGVLSAVLLTAGCASQQATIQQQQEKLESLGATTQLIGQDWLAGHVSATFAATAFEATLSQVEQQRAVLAGKPSLLVDARAARLSQQAEQLSRLLAQLQHDVTSGDTAALRGRLSSIPLVPETK
jgi:hypothetical protein